jgi:hypothetical protein
VKKLLLAAVAGLLMAACSEAPMAPSSSKGVSPSKANADLECRSGYVIAFDKDGNPYCAPEGDGLMAGRPSGLSSR